MTRRWLAPTLTIIVLLVVVFVYIGSLHRPKPSPHARAVQRLRRLPRGAGDVSVEVNGLPWKRVGNVRLAEAGASVFELGTDGKLRFGDGTHGNRPPEGAQIIVRYREGTGAAGNV